MSRLSGARRTVSTGNVVLDCATRRTARVGCRCAHCAANRQRENARREALLDRHRDGPRAVKDCLCAHCEAKRMARLTGPQPTRWRCGCGRVVLAAQCECGVVAAWASGP